jgi:hypothetical protein
MELLVERSDQASSDLFLHVISWATPSGSFTCKRCRSSLARCIIQGESSVMRQEEIHSILREWPATCGAAMLEVRDSRIDLQEPA